MDDSDLYGLSFDDEGTAAEKAQALAAALLRTKQLGNTDTLIGGQLAGLGNQEAQQYNQGQQSLLKAGENRLLRNTEATRNAALAQYHNDVISQRQAEEERKRAADAARPGEVVGSKETDDGTLVGVTRDGQAKTLHVSTKKLVGPGKGGGAAETPVTLETAQPWEVAAAHDYEKTKQLPPLGKDVGAKKRILALHAQLYGNEGAAGSAAGFKADSGSLTHLTQQADAVNSFTRTFDKNIGILEDSLGKLSSSGSPLLNKGYRSLQKNVTGDPNYTSFVNALNTVRSELGKINSGSTGAGGVPITVLQEMEHGLPENATPAQFLAAFKVYKQDSENRRKSMQEQIDEIHGRMSGKKANTEAAPSAAPAAKPADPAARVRARLLELDPDHKADPGALKAKLISEGLLTPDGKVALR